MNNDPLCSHGRPVHQDCYACDMKMPPGANPDRPAIEKTYDARRVPPGFPPTFEDRCLQLMQEQTAAVREQTEALKEIATTLRIINENGTRRSGVYG